LGLTAIPMPVIVRSGAHVVGDFTAEIASGTIVIPEVVISSGLHVQISGQHVYVESGVHVISESGSLHTFIDGGMVEVESGLHVVSEVEVSSGLHVVGDFSTTVESGLGVLISGQHVCIGSGIFLASGQGGGGTTPAAMSGQYVIIESGIGVITVANVSGQPVTISGDHVYVESGVHVVGDFTTTVDSGLHVVVGSGIHVVSEVEVSSGLHVVQGKTAQLQDYFISDIDESDEGIKFYGYLDAEGNWYIMQSTSGTTYRYASSGVYASNWIDRSGIDYQAFDQEF